MDNVNICVDFRRWCIGERVQVGYEVNEEHDAVIESARYGAHGSTDGPTLGLQRQAEIVRI